MIKKFFKNEFCFSISDILRKSASALPEKEAIIDSSQTITYRDLENKSNALTCYLIGRGVKKRGQGRYFFR